MSDGLRLIGRERWAPFESSADPTILFVADTDCSKAPFSSSGVANEVLRLIVIAGSTERIKEEEPQLSIG